MTRWADLDVLRPAVAADVQVVTSDGKSIATHSFVLGTASPVLERMIERARRGWNTECIIPRPRRLLRRRLRDFAFLQLLYASRVTPEDEEVVTAHGPSRHQRRRRGATTRALAPAQVSMWTRRVAIRVW
nr:uncharacterized protein LOC107279064 isoform X2 [Oryza sativa Japonica Group]